MTARQLALTIALCGALVGCEYAFSDVATRVRYSLQSALARLQLSDDESLTITLQPNHRPDRCPEGEGYRLTISPYKGGKEVASGDIVVHCDGGHDYYTGIGSAELGVARELAVTKQADAAVRITLRRVGSSIEIVGLE